MNSTFLSPLRPLRPCGFFFLHEQPNKLMVPTAPDQPDVHPSYPLRRHIGQPFGSGHRATKSKTLAMKSSPGPSRFALLSGL